MSIKVERISSDSWQATYSLPKKIKELKMWIPSGGIRSSRWAISQEGGWELVDDRETLILEKPSDEIVIRHPNLPTGLAYGRDFHLQFSQGDILAYTGYYNAFEALDKDGRVVQFSELNFEFSSALAESIAVNNSPWQNPAHWTASVEDEKLEALVFFGQVEISPQADDIKLYADPNLPTWIQAKLERGGLLGRYVQYFQSNLYRREDRPSVFFPYVFWQDDVIPSAPQIEEDSNIFVSGRVIPNAKSAQVTVGGRIFQTEHPILEGIVDGFLLGHEIVHLWNSENINNDKDHSWLWEGSAESLTYYAMVDLEVGSQEFRDQYRLANLVKCLEGMAEVFESREPLLEQSAFSYGCGFLFNYLASELSNRVDSSPFRGNYEFWSPLLADSFVNETLINPATFLARVSMIPSSNKLRDTIMEYLRVSDLGEQQARGRPFFELLDRIDNSNWYKDIELDIEENWPSIDWDSYRKVN